MDPLHYFLCAIAAGAITSLFLGWAVMIYNYFKTKKPEAKSLLENEQIKEISTDFLLWYIDRGILPKDDLSCIYDLWDEFKKQQ